MSKHEASPFDHPATRGSFLKFAAAAMLTLAASLATVSAHAMPQGMDAPTKPTAMPTFELPTVAGTTLRSDTLKGRTLVIRFWASW
jgi:cytochrome oxidase Cu insertion factor (SCO1/SenC/PrrC family)